MSDITTFFLNNIWLCLGVGALVLIIADEVLGVSRSLLADPTDNLPYAKAAREREHQSTPPAAEFDDLQNLEETEGGLSVDDMLRPK